MKDTFKFPKILIVFVDKSTMQETDVILFSQRQLRSTSASRLEIIYNEII